MKFRHILLVSSISLFCAASMYGQLSHTWVSLSGSDTYPCTASLPCLSFAGALTKTSAGGLITAKDAGDFGSVSINQSVTIDGSNLGSITFNSSSGVFIASTANVTLQNLTINGLGTGQYGIFVANGGFITIDNCKIMNFVYNGIYFQEAGNLTVENSSIESFIGNAEVYGIEMDSNAAENVVVRNTLIDASPVTYNNVGFLINLNTGGTVTASLQNVNIRGAGSGAIKSNTGVTQITGSVLTQSMFGVYAANGSTVSVANSQITSNVVGICSSASSKVRLDNNDIYDNPTAIASCGGIVKTSTTNKTSGTIAIPASDVSDSVTF